uniref:Pseudouridine synthase n=1 Tax=Candidatus Aschnera chinzeii TaxID=1485666 RepID=A0AAT9G543_9ENTR|nr:MAG: 23S rRNA pseudouridine(1911/1915/1917) synthase RluD [Candidatus Aschnera chinzeii]
MTKMLKIQTKILKSQSGQRLDYALVKLLTIYSRSLIKKWIVNKSVTVNGIIIDKPKQKMLGKECIYINTSYEDQSYWVPENIPLNIIYEDKEILIINKPRNLVVHPGAGNLSGTLLNALLYYYPDIHNVPRAGIVSRLDKNTTGIMIIAKTITSYFYLINAFKKGEIIRNYEAIVNGRIYSDGIINKPIGRHIFKRTRMAVNKSGKIAITHYNIIETYQNHTRVKLQLQSGRTHQIRVHMSYIKHPVFGDPVYGSKILDAKGISKQYLTVIKNFNHQALHAVMLQIIHPITYKVMQWNTTPPDDMIELINILKIHTIT